MFDIAVVMFSFLVAGFVHTATGFGSALVGMPLLALALSVPVAAPLMALLSQIVNVVVLYQNWHGLHFREAIRLILASLPGIWLGLLLLQYGNEKLITAALGVLLLAYGLYSLLMERWLRNRLGEAPAAKVSGPSEPWGWAVASAAAGLLAGILGGAYNANGPPLIIYGTVRRWPKEQFKSVLQAFFLINGVLIVAGHAKAGLITGPVLMYCLYGLPAIVTGMYLGWLVDRRLDAGRFRVVVLWLIVVFGVMLLAA